MDDDYPDEMEERLINEEYKIWKKNTPFLYGQFAPTLMLQPSPHSLQQQLHIFSYDPGAAAACR